MRSTSARNARDVGRRDGLRDAATGILVEHRPQLVDLVGLREVDPSHEHAAILFEAHQPRFLERAKGLAHRARATRRAAAAIVGLVELGAGGQLAGQDHAARVPAGRGRAANCDCEQRDRAVGVPRCGAPAGAASASDGEAAGPPPFADFSMLRLDDVACRLSTICNRHRRPFANAVRTRPCCAGPRGTGDRDVEIRRARRRWCPSLGRPRA